MSHLVEDSPLEIYLTRGEIGLQLTRPISLPVRLYGAFQIAEALQIGVELVRKDRRD